MSPAVNTRRVGGRRPLRFADFSDVRHELESLASASAAGRLGTIGNWTPGQVFAHLAAFMNYPYDGYPESLRNPPWLIRRVLGLRKRRFVRHGMPSGVRIPGVEGGTTGVDDVSVEEGLSRLRSAMDRMERAAPTHPNPVLGPLTHEEWIQVNCRHAELHLSFLEIRG